MYKTFYSLSREPFSKETNPSEAYQGASYQERGPRRFGLRETNKRDRAIDW
ncbi:hypothetical protein HNR78_002661 [Parageobacillus toebii NBRC 107807]|uniref:Uncharacterized protein n=1 Tax=Parageobacillus toebii NBRC 107807 TaxID=1223503 RepID=A0AA89NPM1_9BACL|nr:hypothetical protein [Parageobacillus toebii NBRC 107807]